MRPTTAFPLTGVRTGYLPALILLCAILFQTAGCKKGDTGPAGATGAQGPAGAKGEKGDNGTANVFYSDWFTPVSFIKDTVFEVWRFHKDIPAPAITQEIMDSGSVLVYAKMLLYNSAIWPADQVSLMPVILSYKEGVQMNDTWSALDLPGVLRIQFINDHNYYSSMGGGNSFRYIVIPGGLKATTAAGVLKGGQTETNATGSAPSSRKWQDLSYEEVCAALQIPG